ncbi:hypothetical protein [Halomontanus rarus]|uniref:hypothetical protein n=1 Tax=Halomontanus rarus TaxID=3034020 RepID=UPI0023E7E420|nr:hypothetical protein [Halovivax sp. TS33]
MSTKSSGRQKRTDHKPLRHFYLGKDAEGDYHHYSRQTGLVYTITDDGEIAYADRLNQPNTVKLNEPQSIDYYRHYVASKRGPWQEIVILPMIGQRVSNR